MPSGSRLVARIFRPGQPGAASPPAPRRPSTRCSQLSSTRSSCLAGGSPAASSSSGRPGGARTPSVVATAWAIRLGSASDASSTSQTPSANACGQRRRRLEREAGLADAARAGQRQQAGRRRAAAGSRPRRARARRSWSTWPGRLCRPSSRRTLVRRGGGRSGSRRSVAMSRSSSPETLLDRRHLRVQFAMQVGRLPVASLVVSLTLLPGASEPSPLASHLSPLVAIIRASARTAQTLPRRASVPSARRPGAR